ncbi:MAG: ACT domain-containing protein [Opitutus sp.]|nr:ACT domain-containing protein [Opitutus sp.]
MPLVLQLMPGEFAVARLAPSAPIPEWAHAAAFSSITRTADELSIICPAAQVPAEVKQERGWAMLGFQGPFGFTLTGVLSSVLAPLAAAKIGVLAVSTFDTDYLMVKQADLETAITALRAAGHTCAVELARGPLPPPT